MPSAFTPIEERCLIERPSFTSDPEISQHTFKDCSLWQESCIFVTTGYFIDAISKHVDHEKFEKVDKKHGLGPARMGKMLNICYPLLKTISFQVEHISFKIKSVLLVDEKGVQFSCDYSKG